MSSQEISAFARFARNPIWSLCFVSVMLVEIVLLIFRVTEPAFALIGTLLGLGVVVIYYTPARRDLRRLEKGGYGLTGLMMITVLLWYQSALWISYTSYLAPLFALCFGLVVSAAPPAGQALLIILAMLLEVGMIYNHPISNVDMSWHLALHIAVVLTLPRVITPKRLASLMRPSSSAVVPEEGSESFTAHLVPLDEESRARAHVAPSPLSTTARPQREAEEATRPSSTRHSAEYVSMSGQLDPRLSPLPPQTAAPAGLSETPAPQAPLSAGESRELDLGLSTRQLQPFEIGVQLDELRVSSDLRRKRPVDFIDGSCELLLGYLARLTSAESAVLIWRRSDGDSAVVRWRWTLRGGARTWSPHPFSMSDPLIARALKSQSVMCLMRDEEGWDGALPYYVPGAVQAGGMMAVPICAYEGAAPDGLLCVDRDSLTPWSEQDRFVAFYVAHKLTLDLDVSHFMKQLVYDSDLSERLLFALQRLHSSRAVGDLVRALLDALVVQDSCTWLAVCLARPKGMQVVGSWGAERAPRISEDVYPLGVDYVSESMRLGVAIDVSGEGLQRLMPMQVPELARLAQARVLPLVDSDGERFGAVVLGVTERGLLAPPYINTLELVVREATEKLSLINAHDLLREQAMTDGLTQLRNHRTFQLDLDQFLRRASRAGASVGLILLDIDHFKSINDTYGHPFGDAVLRGVAQQIKTAMREVDLVARYGGEEFAIALDLSQDEDALIAAERARAAVEGLVFTAESREEVRVTISLGLSFYPHDASSKELLIDRADQALYQAKRRGRNRLVVWRDVSGEPGLSSGMCTRHPVSVLIGAEGLEGAADAERSRGELQGLNALITPSRGVPRREEVEEMSIFNTGENELFLSRARVAERRGAAPSSPSSPSSPREPLTGTPEHTPSGDV